MANLIRVRGSRSDGKVCVWEVHPAHPGGEIFVAGDAEVQASRTRRVDTALKAGVLVEVLAVGEDETGGDEPLTAGLLETFEDERITSALIGAGYDTVEKIRAASDEELRAVDGIGPKSLASIRKALA